MLTQHKQGAAEDCSEIPFSPAVLIQTLLAPTVGTGIEKGPVLVSPLKRGIWQEPEVHTPFLIIPRDTSRCSEYTQISKKQQQVYKRKQDQKTWTFIAEKTVKTNKHEKTDSISLMIRDMQSKTSRYHFRPIQLAKRKKLDKASVGEDRDQESQSITAGSVSW